MPRWGEVLHEIQRVSSQTPPMGGISAFDVVRRQYLNDVFRHTGRNVILYASRWTQGGGEPQTTSITPEDIHGFMEVVGGLPGPALDLIVHSPGGSAEATEALVTYLRSKFSDLRVFVPHAAMSAATMLACAGDRIVMGRHSFLGPIDPQLIMQTELGARSMPAYAILEQFELAKREVKQDPTLLPAWLPILRQYGPALIVTCQLHQQLAETLVRDWLQRFMLKGNLASAASIAKALSSHNLFMSHSRFISRDDAKQMGLVVDDLESDQTLQDAVLSVFHAASHAFSATPCAKIIENHEGKAFIKSGPQQQFMLLPPPQQPFPFPMPFPTPPAAPP